MGDMSIILSQERSRSRRRKLKKGFLFVSIVLVMAVASSGVLLAPQFRVANIIIMGNKTVPSVLLERDMYSFLARETWLAHLRNNILFAPLESMEHSIRTAYPRIKRVDAARSLPATIFFSIEEREPWGIYCAPDCFYIDGEGVLMEAAPQMHGSLIPRIDGAQGGDAPVLGERVMQIVRVFHADLSRRIEHLLSIRFQLGEVYEEDIFVDTNEGWRIFLDTHTDPVKASEDLRLVLEKEVGEQRTRLEYVDLRFKGRVFYKLRE